MFIENHRGFCIFLNAKSTISMFIEYHRRFWVVFNQMFHKFVAYFRLSCHSQGKSPTVCIQVCAHCPSEMSNYLCSCGIAVLLWVFCHRRLRMVRDIHLGGSVCSKLPAFWMSYWFFFSRNHPRKILFLQCPVRQGNARFLR